MICVSRARASSLLPRLPLSIPLCTLMVCLCEAPFALRRVSSSSCKSGRSARPVLGKARQRVESTSGAYPCGAFLASKRAPLQTIRRSLLAHPRLQTIPAELRFN